MSDLPKWFDALPLPRARALQRLQSTCREGETPPKSWFGLPRLNCGCGRVLIPEADQLVVLLGISVQSEVPRPSHRCPLLGSSTNAIHPGDQFPYSSTRHATPPPGTFTVSRAHETPIRPFERCLPRPPVPFFLRSLILPSCFASSFFAAAT